MTIWFAGSKQEAVMSETVKLSCAALLALSTGAYVTRGKWILDDRKSRV